MDTLSYFGDQLYEKYHCGFPPLEYSSSLLHVGNANNSLRRLYHEICYRHDNEERASLLEERNENSGFLFFHRNDKRYRGNSRIHEDAALSASVPYSPHGLSLQRQTIKHLLATKHYTRSHIFYDGRDTHCQLRIPQVMIEGTVIGSGVLGDQVSFENIEETMEVDGTLSHPSGELHQRRFGVSFLTYLPYLKNSVLRSFWAILGHLRRFWCFSFKTTRVFSPLNRPCLSALDPKASVGEVEVERARLMEKLVGDDELNCSIETSSQSQEDSDSQDSNVPKLDRPLPPLMQKQADRLTAEIAVLERALKARCSDGPSKQVKLNSSESREAPLGSSTLEDTEILMSMKELPEEARNELMARSTPVSTPTFSLPTACPLSDQGPHTH